MNIMENFSGAFGDFETLFYEAELSGYVVRFYSMNDNPDCEGDAIFKVVVGFTELGNGDILLHMIDAEGADSWDEVLKDAEIYGVEFALLSVMLSKYGFEIVPCDQFDDEDDELVDCDFYDDCNLECEGCKCSEEMMYDGISDILGLTEQDLEEFEKTMSGILATGLLSGLFEGLINDEIKKELAANLAAEHDRLGKDLAAKMSKPIDFRNN